MAHLPTDIAARHSLEFIKSHLHAPCSLLEIGCGDGDLAAALSAEGFDVTAIDNDVAAITKARVKGVNATKATWPTDLSINANAIIFTRSLHHIHPLDNAIRAAHAGLNRAGILLVEDFAYDDVDAKTVNWFVKALRAPNLAAVLTPPKGSFVESVLASDYPTSAWHADHDHHLHSIGVMQQSISKLFDGVEVFDAPYLYRYLIPALPETQHAAHLLGKFLDQEDAAISAGEIFPVGKRIVAKK